jgi:NitT/TauT family transport system substrate-binding protein
LIRHARRVAALALVPILLSTAGCGLLGDNSTESTPGAGGLEKGTITVASVATVDLAAFWIALDGGYFTAEGLTAREVPAAKTEVALTKIESGEVDVGLSTYTAILTAQAKGVFDLKLVTDVSWASAGSNAIMTAPGSGVTNVHDLAGKRIAVSAVNQASGVLTKSVMADNGVDFSQVRWLELPLPNMAQALKDHQVDAAYQPEPFKTQASKLAGATPVIDAGSGSTENFPLTGFAAQAKWTLDNPKTMAAFQRAMDKATRYAVSHREAVESVVVKHTTVTADIASLMTLPGMGSRLDARRIQRVPDLLKQLRVIDKDVDAAAMIVPQVTG